VVPQLDQGRLPMKVIVKKREVPKKAVKVTPWWKGPEWEGCIGSGTDGLEVYRIQLLNGALRA
jgi:chromatin assembly factor 1 subunit A